MKINKNFDIINQIITDGAAKGILHLYNEDTCLHENYITLKGKPVVNFGSCSYLGLEFDNRLKNEAIKAIQNYGTQFSESRAYVSLKLYKELENNFNTIFDAFTVITPTTTLGHVATIPVIVSDEDAVIMDHQVHSSVQTAIALIKHKGTHTELLRHNRMDILEERIITLRKNYKTIWYMADGIYSMFGDQCPVDKIYELLDKYPELHFYVDDAHGMSIYGKHGRGFVLQNRNIHHKMVLATSLAKGFATGGAVMVFPTKELALRVRTCGGPLITSGPMQPAQLGAALAATKIHLSPEIISLQNELQDRITFTNLLLKKYELPVISGSDAAVFFIGVSLPKIGYHLISKMLEKGYYLNLGIFPAVPIKNTGIRFTITRLHTLSQIENMVRDLAKEFAAAIVEEKISLREIYKAFKIECPEETDLNAKVNSVIKQSLDLNATLYNSIEQINKSEWNTIFKNKGTFDYDGLIQLEKTFSNNPDPENNWLFDYVVIRDTENNIVLATFFTTAIWKDDMLSPASVSIQIEKERNRHKYYLTSKVLSTGSLLTEGEHLYLDKTSRLWKEALLVFLDKVNILQENNSADKIVLRDFTNTDVKFDSFLIDNGYFKFSMPDNHILSNMQWDTETGFYQQLSRCSKDHFRKQIKKFESLLTTTIVRQPSKNDLANFYQLYLNVKSNSLTLNTFTLPLKTFEQMTQNKNWEIIKINLSKTIDIKEAVVAVIFCYKTENSYFPMIIGLDYTYNQSMKIYKQALYQLVKRGRILQKENIHLGFSASIEKRKLGATVIPTFGYMQAKDNYNFQVIDSYNNNSTNKILEHIPECKTG